MAVYLEKDLKFAGGSGHRKGCSLGVIGRSGKGRKVQQKVRQEWPVTPGITRGAGRCLMCGVGGFACSYQGSFCGCSFQHSLRVLARELSLSKWNEDLCSNCSLMYPFRFQNNIIAEPTCLEFISSGTEVGAARSATQTCLFVCSKG